MDSWSSVLLGCCFREREAGGGDSLVFLTSTTRQMAFDRHTGPGDDINKPTPFGNISGCFTDDRSIMGETLLHKMYLSHGFVWEQGPWTSWEKYSDSPLYLSPLDSKLFFSLDPQFPVS